MTKPKSIIFLIFCLLTTAISQIINVRSYPYLAQGNGLADDQPAIQRAIDSAQAHNGGIVYFPEGIYFLASNIGTIETPDNIDAPQGYPTTFSRGIVHLRDTVDGISFIGDGSSHTIIRTKQSSTILHIASTTRSKILDGITIDGISFENSGGWFGGKDGGYYGIYIKAISPKITRCKFKNFLNGLILAPGTKNALVEDNEFLWEHGRASVGYPLYPNRDNGNIYFDHPTVGLRNYGFSTRAFHNYTNGLVDGNFSALNTVPDEFKIPADGFNHGYGSGGSFIGNNVTAFSYEAFFSQDGPNPSETQVVYSGNTVDGKIPTMTGISKDNSNKKHEFAQYGIRVDCDNAAITGNTIMRISEKAIVLSSETKKERHNFTITGNILTNSVSGIYIDNVSDGVINGNLITPLNMANENVQNRLAWRYGIFIAGENARRIVISGNNIQGLLDGWFFKSSAIKSGVSEGSRSLILDDASKIKAGDWMRFGFNRKLSAGYPVYISKIKGTTIEFNIPLFKNINSNDTIYFSDQSAFEFAGVGIAISNAKNLTISGNLFSNCVEPFRNSDPIQVYGENTFLNCIMTPKVISSH